MAPPKVGPVKIPQRSFSGGVGERAGCGRLRQCRALRYTTRRRRATEPRHPHYFAKKPGAEGAPDRGRVTKHDMNSWGDEPENCRLGFAKLMKLADHPDVKADIVKVRGARGRDYAFKAESLAVELSGSSDDDN